MFFCWSIVQAAVYHSVVWSIQSIYVHSEVLIVVVIPRVQIYNLQLMIAVPFLQCFDAVGWAAGRASGL